MFVYVPQTAASEKTKNTENFSINCLLGDRRNGNATVGCHSVWTAVKSKETEK